MVVMRVVDRLINKAQVVVPMERQIQGLHLFQRAKRLMVDDGQPRFEASEIPDVADLDLTEIDVSNPFLWRQGQWQPYFARLRDEAPVHFRADSAFGPFWSVTRYDDIVSVDKDFQTFSAEPQIILARRPKDSISRCSSRWTRRATTSNAPRFRRCRSAESGGDGGPDSFAGPGCPRRAAGG